MFDTTKDIFWLVAGISLGVFTFFVCWTLYYVVMMLKDAHTVINSIKQKFELVDKILELVREKLEKTSSHIGMISETVMKIASFFMEKSENGKEKKKKKSGE